MKSEISSKHKSSGVHESLHFHMNVGRFICPSFCFFVFYAIASLKQHVGTLEMFCLFLYLAVFTIDMSHPCLQYILHAAYMLLLLLRHDPHSLSPTQTSQKLI